jgi:ABC-type transport system substrate-binding protein
MRSTRARAVFLAVALATTVTACGSSDDDSSDSVSDVSAAPTSSAPSTEASTAATTAPSATTGATTETSDATGSTVATEDSAAPTLSVPDGKPGGSLVYGTYGEGAGFDPIKRGLSYCNTALYDSLLKFDDEGVAQPYMAESMTTDDNLVWTMTLRDGILFHDDTPLNAEAVIFNIERHKDPANASANAVLANQIASMKAVDDLTIEFTLATPLSVFPAFFAQANGLGIIISPTAFQASGADYNLHPVGAGPFVFQEWIPDDHLTLTRNDKYWQSGLPYLDELICRPLPDTQTRAQAITNGDTDLTYMITAAEIQQAKEVDSLTVLEAKANGAEGIILNDNRPPFDDPRMREAFVSLMNLDVIAEVRFAGQKDLTGAIGLIDPSSVYYNPEVEEAWPTFNDMDRAKELIEEYRAEGNDPNFVFKLPNTPDRRRFGDMMAQFFGDAGLNVENQYLDISEFVTGVLNTHDFQAAINSYPAFVGIYPQVFNAYHTGGLSNFGDFSDPKVDALIDTAISTTDPDEAVQAWKDAQLEIAKAIPYATYGRPSSAIITQKYVAGVVKYPDNTIFFAGLSRTDS